MAAVADLFEAHHRRLVGLARLLVDDQETAEEVVQEAFLASTASGAYCGTPRPPSRT